MIAKVVGIGKISVMATASLAKLGRIELVVKRIVRDGQMAENQFSDHDEVFISPA